ncbi:hypothetical protein ACCO45_007134 [Purpureocillium lilacinum]|uniref:Uncharacterized protein n=1 Tax=Purpureocillium lilacinum TaxID=33203 RepID=A0ACC4DRI9_PURLI
MSSSLPPLHSRRREDDRPQERGPSERGMARRSVDVAIPKPSFEGEDELRQDTNRGVMMSLHLLRAGWTTSSMHKCLSSTAHGSHSHPHRHHHLHHYRLVILLPLPMPLILVDLREGLLIPAHLASATPRTCPPTSRGTKASHLLLLTTGYAQPDRDGTRTLPSRRHITAPAPATSPPPPLPQRQTAAAD